MKKGWLITIGLVLAGCILAFIWYRQQVKRAAEEPYGTVLKPRLELSSWEVTDIDADLVKVNGKLLIDNPLPVGFKAKRMYFEFLIDSTVVSRGDYPQTIAVEPSDSSTITIPVEVPLKPLEAKLKHLYEYNIDSVVYTVRTRFDLDVPLLGNRTFTDTLNRKLPTVYVPTLKIERVKIGKIGLNESELAMNISVGNRNAFPIRFFDTRYVVSVDGKEIAEGYQPDSILIEKQSTTPVVLPLTLKPNTLLGLTGKMLFDKKDTPMLVRFQCKLIDKDGDNLFRDSKMTMRVEGTMAEFMQAATQLK